ncbi:MAG: acyl-CoA dehydratase activase [Desulfobacterales bacterium]|nr:acyl-CoA dehydratase activase [Desulfobacterales bacterium]
MMTQHAATSSDSDVRPSSPLRALGLCLGASTVSVVQVEYDPAKNDSRPHILNYGLHPHEGDPKQTLQNALESIDISAIDRIAATGRRFREFVNLSSIPEPEAVEQAYQMVKMKSIDSPAIVSAGGETFMVYTLNKSGRISNVHTGNKCASGTGEFFLQQLRRMNVSLKEAAQWAVSQDPYAVSGRCSVFCKSDCTHATNKGIPKAKVTAGLCQMMANKILELLKKVERQNIMVTGGTAQNKMMIEYLRREIPGLIVPNEAPYFEALGAALWALNRTTKPFPGFDRLFNPEATSFESLLPLQEFEELVEFKSVAQDEIQSNDQCILGLDVGSTTTKAVLLRKTDNAILASVYLRTNGDPVGASRNCYQSILSQISNKIDPNTVAISGLGVCGSGRQIAGLHALTDGVINEIIAHATAAVYFDSQVDTIFEIGGQDAKYTYITNAVPSDYAMNEACSAGTGSFLEESALETLGVKMEDIADIAMQGHQPPNFNDQCAAFIASDIKNAIHEGIAHNDIVAGLVYSICMNYANRVKGNRPVGEKVFMQGGVCYNRAVPLAMAALVGKPIIVPPEPGLMGAFGVALEVKKRIEAGLLKPQRFDLADLVQRDIDYNKSFICKGGKEQCDRRCDIAMINIEGTQYPFGGACNRYYNLRHMIKHDVATLDLVRIRQKLIFEKYAGKLDLNSGQQQRGRIGLNRSFLINTYYPFYSTFFAELGYETVLPDEPSQAGIDLRGAPFCFPAELTHGFFHSLLAMPDPPDFIFLPHFKAVPSQSQELNSEVCPLVQSETYYLRSAFKEKIEFLKKEGVQLLTPVIDFSKDMHARNNALIDTAVKKLGVRRGYARKAFQKAVARQEQCLKELKAIGARALAALEEDPDQMAIVILGRPYNSFVDEAHMGIPHKIASRGFMVMPLDFLPLEDEQTKRHMYWGMGQLIVKAARFVKKHPQLFATYITNFSCGPDSFVIGYVRDIMGRKPSLTLELDSHTADAGLETRIEAFIDIVAAYRRLLADQAISVETKRFNPARFVLNNGDAHVFSSSGEMLSLTDPRVTMLLPSMGRIGSEVFAAVLRGRGFNAKAHEPSNENVLKLGRANTSCKECLPLILTTGTLLNYIRNGKRDDEVVLYFMFTGSGPCRFGQYRIFMEDLIRRQEIADVALFSLTSENSYIGMGEGFDRIGWWAVVISDVLEDIRAMLLANAQNTDAAQRLFEKELCLIIGELETGDYTAIEHQLARTAESLQQIPLKRSPEAVPTILLAGEIFVRRDGLSRQYLTEKLAAMGFATICSPVAEWVLYANYLVKKGLAETNMTLLEKLKFNIRCRFMAKYEKQIKSLLARSGLVHDHPMNVEKFIKNASPYMAPDMTGEAILTIGGSITEISSNACGVIAIGPFGCMPNRISEAILAEAMNRDAKLKTEPDNHHIRAVLADVEDLPFLAIESDGSPFPQLINAKLETFCMRAERLHEKMLAVKASQQLTTAN